MRPCTASLNEAVELIDKASKVTILAGTGATGAMQELLAIARQLKAPVIRTLRAEDILDVGDRECIGGLGLLGNVAGSGWKSRATSPPP